MKQIATTDLVPGMITARPVYTNSGQLIINSNVELNPKLIARVDFYSITQVMVVEENDSSPPSQDVVPAAAPVPGTADVSQNGDVKNPSYSQIVKRSPKFQEFQKTYSKKIETVKDSLEQIINAKNMDPSKLLSDTMGLLNVNRLNTIELFDMLHNMRQMDDSIYAHSINVGMIARVLGKWLKFSKEDIDELTLAGLLHDIGKMKIPESILNKPGKLSPDEFDIIKMHPKLGYDTLVNAQVSFRVRQAVLMHHERCDGSGYPLGVSIDRLNDFSMVLAIADVYDAMTAARAYRGPLCPFQVIASFEEDGLQKYNPHFILTFLERIANTYQNNRVLLSDGRKGTVILLNQSHLSRPIVQLEDDSFLDLSNNHSITISAVI